MLPLREAAEYLGIKKELLQKFMKNSEEIPYHRINRRYYLEQSDLDAWLELKNDRYIELNFDDYKKALEFAFRINYSGHTTSDFGTSRQRGIVKAISDWTQGMLAEIAFQKFIHQKYNIHLDLDFSVHDYIVGQDITSVRRRNTVSNPPRIRVSIKSGKMNGCFIIIGESEYELEDRRSDFYVFVRLDYPEDHLIRALKDHEIISSFNLQIPDLGVVKSYITGYIDRTSLELTNEIPGQKFDSNRYVKKIGALYNSDDDWNNFVERL